jgi:hypothetical protein
MNERFTTLGSGKSTKVLDTSGDGARVVTTCSQDVAQALVPALHLSSTCLLSALHGVALEADGEPLEARRVLLARFDAVLAGTPSGSSGKWALAHEVVDKVALAVKDAPEPVQKAVRRELSEHLSGLDGVLVPARVRTWEGWYLDLVLTPVLPEDPDAWAGELEVDGLDSSGREVSALDELAFDLLDALFDQSTLSPEYAQVAMSDLFREAGPDDIPTLEVRVDHLLVWARSKSLELRAKRA